MVEALPRTHHIASPRDNIQAHAPRKDLDPSDFVLLSGSQGRAWPVCDKGPGVDETGYSCAIGDHLIERFWQPDLPASVF